MPGTVMVLGSSLTRTCFFFQTGNILFQKNCRPMIFSTPLRSFQVGCMLTNLFVEVSFFVLEVFFSLFAKFLVFLRNFS